jgi:hypothetical protein
MEYWREALSEAGEIHPFTGGRVEDVPDHLEKESDIERLPEDAIPRALAADQAIYFLRAVARHERNFAGTISRFEPFHEVDSSHLRHDNIHQRQRYTLFFTLIDIQSFSAASSSLDRVSGPRQDLTAEFQRCIVVVDDKNRLRT